MVHFRRALWSSLLVSIVSCHGGDYLDPSIIDGNDDVSGSSMRGPNDAGGGLTIQKGGSDSGGREGVSTFSGGDSGFAGHGGDEHEESSSIGGDLAIVDGIGGNHSAGGNDQGSSGSGGLSHDNPRDQGIGGSGETSDREDAWTTTVGRLPTSAVFCWLPKPGHSPFDEYEEKKRWIEHTSFEWKGTSALKIRWVSSCSAGEGDESIRVLLDDSVIEEGELRHCDGEARYGPWARFPNEEKSASGCDVDVIVPWSISESRTILHVFGHALGFSHTHILEGRRPICRLDLQDLGSFNPYLADYDPASVMHPGWSPIASYSGDPWGTCEGDDTEEFAGLRDARPSAGDRLAMELIYPVSLVRMLGSSGWILVNGMPTFRSGLVRLRSEFAARGANLDWFLSPYWMVSRPGSLMPLIGNAPIFELEMEDESYWYAAHLFTDPFGSAHYLNTQIMVSSRKHAAIVMTIL